MSDLLFIKWDEKYICGYPIIDEQHRGLIATTNSLFYFMQKGWGLDDLKPTILMLEQYVMFHLKTEESILIGKGMPAEELTIIQEYEKSFLSELHEVVISAITNEEPNEVAKYLAKWWRGHELQFHEKLRNYFV